MFKSQVWCNRQCWWFGSNSSRISELILRFAPHADLPLRTAAHRIGLQVLAAGWSVAALRLRQWVRAQQMAALPGDLQLIPACRARWHRCRCVVSRRLLCAVHSLCSVKSTVGFARWVHSWALGEHRVLTSPYGAPTPKAAFKTIVKRLPVKLGTT